MVRDCIPTCVRLQVKELNITQMCKRCGVEQESLSHLLLTCSKSMATWRKLGLVELFIQSLNKFPCIRECVIMPWSSCRSMVEVYAQSRCGAYGRIGI